LKSILAAAALAAALPGAASAAFFSGTYGVYGDALTDPGLVVSTSPGSAFSFNLGSGESKSFDLFKIWTDETDVGKDDYADDGIGVYFDVSSHGASGSVEGKARGTNLLLFQWGSVDWSKPLELDVGTGTLSIALADAVFNKGLFGLTEGDRHGATVGATVSYTAAPVPLPAGLGLIAAGTAALGFAGFRRKPEAA
jgi:hypothetical protein